MKKYHIFHLDTNEDTPGNVLQLWMGEYNFSDWKKPPMNYIIINKTKNIWFWKLLKIYKYLLNHVPWCVIANIILFELTFVTICKSTTHKIGCIIRHLKKIFLYFILYDTYRLKRNIQNFMSNLFYLNSWRLIMFMFCNKSTQYD